MNYYQLNRDKLLEKQKIDIVTMVEKENLLNIMKIIKKLYEKKQEISVEMYLKEKKK